MNSTLHWIQCDNTAFVWGEIITVIFSVVVFYVGISCRLSPEESVEAIEQTQIDD
ncbi:hypothetical protein [Brevibacterium aurantiacum]|uniref:Uncharacterized protein n=1 Tax=Brevibacterium aurantiacum TaxID=273384 RepID=A0A2H1HL90_BREAU|nr:hypothetical protein [Brevibacterium aurantiacum]AOP55171.1 hypothetical protein BLSMQ_3471 [Brevibacterium aurantiacum]SMX63636.1 hypothetical protein BAURA63_00287 [Brevibacterium aurantiacum]SMX69341.1 hypothetical protein BAUR9175_00859 [Brevibacterium aurantiacum]SMX79184.1 hypothetical protein BAURA86_01034 [Brevibacterium aurantiacum]GEB22384.1 hypothetical protein BAU01nite_11170 [Brevibacterium aurantiacum]